MPKRDPVLARFGRNVANLRDKASLSQDKLGKPAKFARPFPVIAEAEQTHSSHYSHSSHRPPTLRALISYLLFAIGYLLICYLLFTISYLRLTRTSASPSSIIHQPSSLRLTL